MLAPTANDAGSLPIWWGRQGQRNAGAQMSQAGGPQTHNHWLLGRIRGTQLVTRGWHQNRIKIVSPVISKDLSQRLVGQLGVDLGQSDKQIGDEVGVDRIAIRRSGVPCDSPRVTRHQCDQRHCRIPQVRARGNVGATAQRASRSAQAANRLAALPVTIVPTMVATSSAGNSASAAMIAGLSPLA